MIFKFLIALSTLFLLFACSKKDEKRSVIIYVSEDQVFSEPILKEFEKKTGITVKAVYDSEESKSTGVMNRLIAEKNNPQADVYWANEPIRAEVLRKKGILTPYISQNSIDIADTFKQKEGYWCGFSARIRLFVVDAQSKDVPHSIFDYADEKFKAKGVIANPLFGTTTAHIAALFTHIGDAKTKAFLKKLKENHIALSASNGESANLIAKKKYLFSLVDSDDAVSRRRKGSDIRIIYPDQNKDDIGLFVVPNTVMLIKGTKHIKEAQELIDYLLSPACEKSLAFADCAQIPLHQGVTMPKELKPISQIKIMDVDYALVADKLLEIQSYLKAWQAD